MVGHSAGEGETILDHVKPVHAVLRRAHAPARSERAHRFEIALAAIEKIAVQRENDIGAIEFRQCPRVRAESGLHGDVRFRAQARFIDTPAHAREIFL